MSYSDIINIVSNSPSRIFNEKIDGQRIHESIKSADITSHNTMPLNNLANSQNFTQLDKLKILRWHCRGLNNKINDLILFSAEKDIDINCVNEVKKWQKTTPLSNYIVAAETYANAHHGSDILIKNNIVIKRVEPVEKENDYRGKTLEILKIFITLPLFGDFWIVSVYNSPGKPLSLEKVFSERTSNVFVCGDFNSPHRELNSSYDCENGENLLNLIEKGHFKLLNNGHYTYQSVDGKSRNMLDLRLCDRTVFNSASRIFKETIDGQRIHESIKSANITSHNTMPPNKLANSQNFTQTG